jgi:hypothetical protein
MQKLLFYFTVTLFPFLTLSYDIDYRLFNIYPEIVDFRKFLQIVFYMITVFYIFMVKVTFSRRELLLIFLILGYLLKDLLFTGLGIYDLSKSQILLETQFVFNTLLIVILFKNKDIRSMFNVYFLLGIFLIWYSNYIDFEVVNHNLIFFMLFLRIIIEFDSLKFRWLILIIVVLAANAFDARNIIFLTMVFIIFVVILKNNKFINTTFIFILQLFTLMLVIFNNKFTDLFNELLNRRVYIWKYYFSLMVNDPVSLLFGNGITSRDTMLNLGMIFETFRPYNQHNMYITYFYENGILALLLFILMNYFVLKGRGRYYTSYFLMCVYLVEETLHFGDFNTISSIFVISFVSLLNKNFYEESSMELKGYSEKEKNLILRTKAIL